MFLYRKGGIRLEKIIYFDYCAVILLLILLLSTISRKMTHGKQNRYFLNLIIVILITALADICAMNLDRLESHCITAKYIFNTLYLFLHTAATPFYVTYLFTLTDVWHRMYKQRFLYALSFVPFLLCSLNTFFSL